MSKPSLPKFRIPALCIAAVALLALGLCAVSFSRLQATNAQATRSSAARPQPPALNAEQRGRVRASLDALPLAFEANQGQTDPQVKYTARGNGYSVFLTANDAVFAISSAKPSGAQASRGVNPHVPHHTSQKLETARIDMRLVGGNANPEIAAGTSLPGIVNFYVGSDPKNWHTGVDQYSSVSYRDVYPGVNMVFHGAQRQLEFDFVVSPGADPKALALNFKGAQKLDTDASGNLVLNSSAGDVVLHKPVAYQEKDGKRQTVEAAFAVRSRNEVALNLGAYDRERELVIDPSLSYATYLGGGQEDDANAITIDASGDAYVTGQTASSNFPTVPSGSTSFAGGSDVFITKIAADGTSLLYSTYIGGGANDSGNAIAVDGSGNAFVAGGTTTPTGASFPTTSGAYKTTFQGGNVDAFVLELASNGGTLMFSTFLGGNGDDVANGIAVDTTGVYVVGSTKSTNFPVSAGALQSGPGGTQNGFVTKLNTSGSALDYSTYLGGSSSDFAAAVAINPVAAPGNAYVTGVTTNPAFPVTPATAFQPTCGSNGTCNGGLEDGFVTVINSGATGLVYSSFLGGKGNDRGLGITVDGSGNAYVTGFTQSSDFPTKSAFQTALGGPQDAFVTAVNPAASGSTSLIYSTLLGGSLTDTGTGIAVDSNKNAYVTGQTNSTDFPKASATQATLGGGQDAFVSEISASGSSLLFSTYLGGSLDENTFLGTSPIGAIAVDSAGANIYVAGNTATGTTATPPFPVTTGAVQASYGGNIDAFVAKYATGVSSNANFTVTNGALSNSSGHAGVSATSTITVTSTNGFNSAVALQCTVSPVVTKGPTCSFDKPSVTPPANSTATATLTVATTAATALLVDPVNRTGFGVMYAIVFPVFGVTLLGAGLQRSQIQRRKFLGFSILGLALTCLLLLPACSSSTKNNGSGGTPTGSYTITVTGTNASTVVTGTPALTLTIN